MQNIFMNINKILLILLIFTLTSNAYTQSVKINEVMYNFGYNLDKLEAGNWVELYNTTNANINIKDWQIKFGDSLLVAPNYNLGPNQFVVVSSKDSLMRANYPSIPLLAGSVSGGLDDNSEQIQILNATGMVIDSLTYYDRGLWPECADGKAQSLSLTSTTANNDNPANWVCSGSMGGTPGLPNTIGVCNVAPPKIIINEINYKSDSINLTKDSGDWVEFYNTSGMAVDLSDWVLYDTDSLFVFPQGTTINPASYLVVASSIAKLVSVHPNVNSYVNLASFMTLSGGGETITLADNNNCKVHRMKYNDTAPWPTSADGGGPTLSLINETYNNKVAGSWAPSSAGGAPNGTPGEANNIQDPCSGGASANLVINEINYNSSSNLNPGNWIEIYNAGNSSVDLSGYKVNNEGEQYIIPPGNSISPGGYIVLADSATQFGFTIECPNDAFLNKDAKLNFSNEGELVSIYDFKTQDYGCLVDSVKYNDKAPWPIEADGDGYTLELKNPNLDNTNPNNWAASSYTLGSPGLANQQTNPIICDCDDVYIKYSTNFPFSGNDIIGAQDSIDFSSPNTLFIANSNYKFYGGKSVEVTKNAQALKLPMH